MPNWSREQLAVGALIRIADATEKMAQEHNKLIRRCERAEKCWELARNNAEKAERSNAALRGVVTKMKRAAQAWYRSRAEEREQ